MKGPYSAKDFAFLKIAPFHTTMKTPLAFLALLAALPEQAAEPAPFAPAPFQLEPSLWARESRGGDAQTHWPAAAFPVLTYVNGVLVPATPTVLNYGRVLLPIGPVRVDYGQPSRAGDSPFGSRDLDAPGPGYREQTKAFR